ncbi:hypothetical protein ACRALDRAFT_2016071 [Sodiomyces alcalophilus JCM 7366]|uniref:uncharacterized protein n=1 Tax=Sodiomyces alcalophilus JCM 7366 TaxID=591952 RepID=UPI0039B522F2
MRPLQHLMGYMPGERWICRYFREWLVAEEFFIPVNSYHSIPALNDSQDGTESFVTALGITQLQPYRTNEGNTYGATSYLSNDRMNGLSFPPACATRRPKSDDAETLHVTFLWGHNKAAELLKYYAYFDFKAKAA